MRKRKLQVFVSSTYADLIPERLAAIEAILAAGHIPAAMEQFTPGDETAWEKIRRWIDESDGYLLILGGRYGSIEPQENKSYVQLEYEYALEQRKPFFSLVIDKHAFSEKVKKEGLEVDERVNPGLYKQFHTLVTRQHCAFWKDSKDIKLSVIQKLPEWTQREDLVGWVRGDEAAGPEVVTELARLSRENHALRIELSSREQNFDGLTFEEMVELLRNKKIDEHFWLNKTCDFREAPKEFERLVKNPANALERIRHTGNLFEHLADALSGGRIVSSAPDALDLMDFLVGFNLAEVAERVNVTKGDRTFTRTRYKLSDVGRRFRLQLQKTANRVYRERVLWATQEGADAGS